MKKTYTLVTLFILIQFSFAQQNKFSKIYFDNSGAYSADAMVKSFDGGLIVAGLYNYSTCSVLKIDSLGVIQWSKTIGSGSNEAFNSVVRTADSCYVMAGKTYDALSSTLDIQIVKIDQSGNLVWSKRIELAGNQEALNIATTIDDGFILTGYESFLTPPYSEIIAVKLDSNGDVEWYNAFDGGNSANIGSSIKPTPDGGFALVGYMENYPPFDGNGILIKLSSTGTIEWANKYNETTPTAVWGSDLVILPDGIISYYSTYSDYVVVKTDFSGIDQWKNAYSGVPVNPGCMNCVSSKIKVLSDGNLIFATGTRAMATISYLVTIDSTGDYQWSQMIFNSAHDVEEADDHGLFILGNGPLIGVRTSSITNPHVGIVKSDSLGNANDCTVSNPSITVTFGTVTQAVAILSTTTHSTSSVVFSPTESNFTLSEMSGCVDIIGGVNENPFEALEIFPNPNHSYFNIKLPGAGGSLMVEISDVTGKNVYVKEVDLSGNDELKVDHHLSAGIYNLSIRSEERRVVRKIVID